MPNTPDGVKHPRQDPPLLSSLHPFRVWCGWKEETVQGRLAKVPKNARTGHNAVSHKRETWTTYPQAKSWAAKSDDRGVGLMLTYEFEDGTHLVGLDVDSCRTREGFHPWAEPIHERLSETFSEVSPSGAGMHYLFRLSCDALAECVRRGALNLSGKGYHSRKIDLSEPGVKREVALFRGGRYFTMGAGADMPLLELDADTVCSVVEHALAVKGGLPAATPDNVLPLRPRDDSESGKGFRRLLDLTRGDRTDETVDAAMRASEHAAWWAKQPPASRTRQIGNARNRNRHRDAIRTEDVLADLDILPAEPAKPIAGYDLAGFGAALRASGWKVRRDVRRGQTRIWSAHTRSWLADSDEHRDALRGAMSRAALVPKGEGVVAWKPGVGAFQQMLHDHLHHHAAVDPFVLWLDRLPAWDNVTRLSATFPVVYGAEDTDLSRFAGTLVPLAAVWRARRPGHKVDTLVALIGREGTFKSSYARFLFPDTDYGRSWSSENVDPFGFDQHETAIALQGPVVVEWAEMASSRRMKDWETAKAFLTRQVDRFRAKYARDAAEHPRRVALYATTNEIECLYDAEGNRRFLPVVVNPAESPRRWFDEHREQLWAEAVALFDDGVEPTVPEDMKAAHRALCGRHVRRNEDLQGWVTANMATIQGRTLTEILDVAPIRLGRANMAKELKAAGFEKVQDWSRGPRRGFRVYRHPDIEGPGYTHDVGAEDFDVL